MLRINLDNILIGRKAFNNELKTKNDSIEIRFYENLKEIYPVHSTSILTMTFNGKTPLEQLEMNIDLANNMASL